MEQQTSQPPRRKTTKKKTTRKKAAKKKTSATAASPGGVESVAPDPALDLQGAAAAADAEAGRLGTGAPGDTPAGQGNPLAPPMQLHDPEADKRSAAMMLQGVAATVTAFFPELQYDQATIQAGAEKIAPLMQKPWFQKVFGSSGTAAGKWADEVNAAIFFGGVIMQSVQTVREHRAKKPAASKPTDQGQPKTEQPASQPAAGDDVEQANTGSIFHQPHVA